MYEKILEKLLLVNRRLGNKYPQQSPLNIKKEKSREINPNGPPSHFKYEFGRVHFWSD